jgi:hypothetical protein
MKTMRAGATTRMTQLIEFTYISQSTALQTFLYLKVRNRGTFDFLSAPSCLENFLGKQKILYFNGKTFTQGKTAEYYVWDLNFK